MTFRPDFWAKFQSRATLWVAHILAETVYRCATLGCYQDVGKVSRFTVEGERCVVSGRSLFDGLEVEEEEEEEERLNPESEPSKHEH